MNIKLVVLESTHKLELVRDPRGNYTIMFMWLDVKHSGHVNLIKLTISPYPYKETYVMPLCPVLNRQLIFVQCFDEVAMYVIILGRNTTVIIIIPHMSMQLFISLPPLPPFHWKN